MQNDSNLNNIIDFKNVSLVFKKENETALSNVSFSISEGEFASIIGASGSGKSTILKIISGLIKETGGEVTKPEETSMAFQSGALFPWLTVYDNVAMGLRTKKISEEKVKREVMKYIELMNMGEFVNKFPSELSGGQRQRVGIARALSVDPKVLLLDEPFSALDPVTTAELHDDIIKIWRETKKTIVMVSHLIEEAVSLSEKVILIKDHTVGEVYMINLPYPRREQALGFTADVMKIRKEFFK